MAAYTKENFPWQAYMKAHPNERLQRGPNTDQHDIDRAYQSYLASGSKWVDPANTPATNPTDTNNPMQTNTGTVPNNPIITPGPADPKVPGQINVGDYASELATDPSKGMTDDMLLGKNTPSIDPNAAGTNIDANSDQFKMTADALNQTAQQVGNNVATTADKTSTVAGANPTQANSYDVATISDQMDNPENQMTPASGAVDPNAVINENQVTIDTQAIGSGFNPDGTVNQTGQALQQYASLDLSNVIDTSTPQGKAMAQALGNGNYVDSKATVAGQMQLLQQQFIDPATGEYHIPAWAAGTARSVSKIASFTGMTGTAATAAMAQAIMEASLPIAQADAKFFQTATLQNLSNKQQSTVNRANVLAKMDLTNADNRMAAAIQNSKNFMDMDLKNLDNEQQAELVNTQARFQAMLEDARQENVRNNFVAESQNDLDKFYAELNERIGEFNSSQINAANQFDAKSINESRQFDVDQANVMERWNGEMENQREQYYRTMQYNIELANAKWRQDVTLKNNDNAFQAAALDVRNMYDLSKEQLSQIWDRSDSLLDYLWKSTENEADRKNKLAQVKLQADSAADVADKQGKGSVMGAIVGAGAGKLFDWAFG